MKLTERSVRLLRQVSALGGDLIIKPPDQVTVFGKFPHDGMVAEAHLSNSIADPVAVKDVHSHRKHLKSARAISLSPKFVTVSSKHGSARLPRCDEQYTATLMSDVDRLDSLFDSSFSGRMTLTKSFLEQVKESASNFSATHIWLSGDGANKVIGRVADLRVSHSDVHTHYGWGTSEFFNIDYEGDLLSFSIKIETLKLLDHPNYEVTFYPGGLAEIFSFDRSITYLLRDQRMEDRFDVIIKRLS